MDKPKSSTSTTVSFLINGKQHTVNSSDVAGTTTLAWYLRNVAGLTGTKIYCGEGICGVCMVTIKKDDNKPRSVNSCLTPVLICDGWSITTVEGLGSAVTGYHDIQTALSAHNGSQCGFCSPGVVMSINSYLEEHPSATPQELEDIMDGNICRCTGYRPIMDTAKAFAAKSSHGLINDIEDMKLTGICERTGNPCPGVGSCGEGGPCGSLKDVTETWHSPKSLEELLYVLKYIPAGSKYRLVAGNTGMGALPNDFPFNEYIDINRIPELKMMSLDPLTFGGGTSITDAIKVMEDAYPQEPQTSLAKHFRRIAATGLRNQASLAGNLMMKHDHNDYPSDVFICLETVGATLEIMNADGITTDLSVGDFIYANMDKKIITKIKIPKLPTAKRELHRLWMNRGPLSASEWKLRTFKIMCRGSLTYAEVHAGFLACVEASNGFLIKETPRIVIGGIRPDFVHAVKTEEFLNGKKMNDNAIFKESLEILAEELDVGESRLNANSLYRKQVALGLFYKFFLYVLGDSASEAVRSGATDIDRGLSSGQQSFDTDESQWPVSQPIEKLEGKRQASGEAEYINDIPTKAGELHAAFVLSSLANCTIASVDPSLALAIPGVVDFVDANDIPGENDWRLVWPSFDAGGSKEEVFCSGKVAYAGQAIGLVVAITRELAQKGAQAVSVRYNDQGKVVVDLEEAMLDPANVLAMGAPMEYGDVKGEMEASERRVSGKFKMGSQYHNHLETHVCIVTPQEDGFEVNVATQDFMAVQTSISKVLNIPANSINGSVRRLGGAYGGKIILPNQVATAAAVAANKIRKPVRLWLSLEDNMKMMGKRTPYFFDYEIGLSKEGKIHAVTSKLYCDGGYNFNDVDSAFAIIFGQNCYKIPALRYSPYGVKTHCPSHCATRAPATVNGHAMMEAIMEHAAAELSMDPLELKKMNMMEKGDPILPPDLKLPEDNPIPEMLQTIEASADLAARKEAVMSFNAANKWKKKGLSVIPMRYNHNIYNKLKYHSLISVYASDGTVAVTHGGIEMGQGINTKVAQAVAKTLGIDVGMISIKPTDVMTNPNGFVTGGSMGSEMNCAAAIKAAEILASRLTPIRAKLRKNATWVEIIQKADDENVDLCAHYMVNPENDNWSGYNVWGATVTEVEVDILTGEMFIVRTDVLQDAGLTTNPNVDIGQVEGAYVMGIGLWTSEKVQYDLQTGEFSELFYKVPVARDIPRDFRISLMKNAKNPLGVLGSKATGEPTMLMSIGILFAIRHALSSARMDQGLSGWWRFDGPATIESIHQNAEINPDNFIF